MSQGRKTHQRFLEIINNNRNLAELIIKKMKEQNSDTNIKRK